LVETAPCEILLDRRGPRLVKRVEIVIYQSAILIASSR
jgi:hypothetical protein